MLEGTFSLDETQFYLTSYFIDFYKPRLALFVWVGLIDALHAVRSPINPSSDPTRTRKFDKV